MNNNNSEDKISLAAAILMNMNMMIGAGIFLNPMFMAAQAGTLSFLGWPIISLIFLPVVLSVATIAKFFPGEGSFYTYSKDTLGHFAGFISGWLYFMGYVAVGTAHLIAIKNILISELGLKFINQHSIFSSFIIILILASLSLFSLKVVGFIQSTATLFKIIPLLLVGLLLFFYWNSNPCNLEMASFGSIFYTIPYALFGFWGFESCVSISHKISGNKNNAAKAILIAFFSTVMIYTGFHLGLLKIMGADNLAAFGVRSLGQFLNGFSPRISLIINALIKSAVSVAHISVCFGTFIACSHLLKSMADNNLLFLSNVLRIQNKSKQPVMALIFQSIFMFLFAVYSTNIAVLACISGLGILLAFVITFISLLIIQTKHRMHLGSLITITAFGTSAFIFYYTALEIGSFSNLIPMIVVTIFGMFMFGFRKLGIVIK